MTTPPYNSQPLTPHTAPQGPAATYPAGSPQSPYGYGQPAQAPMPGCRVCGAHPAEGFTVRAHQGLLVVMRFEKLDGPFCRTCGRAVIRQMTTRTLLLGWWSPLSLVAITPFTLLWNLVAHRKFSKLPASTPAPGRQSLPEGTPVHRRPVAYVALIPAAWAVWAITGLITHAG
ncbi:hypothetical protein [Streptomyces sp. NBC_00624]|uniref:hypothetical protein n=1 Tax=Streptomyces sp. NBC_00624 TaxID=2975791 RepID=UPI002F90B54D